MIRRRIGMLAATLFVVVSANAHASGGTYDVVYCSSANRVFGGEIDSNQAFSARSFCNDASHFNAVQIVNESAARNGRAARAFWKVDDPLAIVGVSGETRMRRADGYEAELYVADGDRDVKRRVAFGGTEPTSLLPFGWNGEPQAQFVTELRCVEPAGCPASPQAHAWVRDLRFEVADFADPEVEVEGSLFDGGWLRGEKGVFISATDDGGGLSRVVLTVNEVAFVTQQATCARAIDGRTGSDFQPCDDSSELSSAVSTESAPFLNGVNVLRSCAVDFATNENCHATEVLVDNEPPSASFALQDTQDPELIRVQLDDDHSGPEGGAIFFRAQGATDWRPLFTQSVGSELLARVDSAAEPPGTYEFRATATDVAGNATETLTREDGTPMTLEFPLRSGVDLSGSIQPGGSLRTEVPYGRKTHVEGLLTGAGGEPLARTPIVVDESFGEGALIRHRITTVTTDTEGRWRHKLPAGPTRSVSATYEGDQRYLEADADVGRLTVETGADLELSRDRLREGHATTFRGEIERLGARIPPAGKLVQLQYHDPSSDRWFTVRNPFRTKSNGRFKFRYSFGTHYVTDVAIQFRLNVPAERGWPYRGTHTGARRVIVEARS